MEKILSRLRINEKPKIMYIDEDDAYQEALKNLYSDLRNKYEDGLDKNFAFAKQAQFQGTPFFLKEQISEDGDNAIGLLEYSGSVILSRDLSLVDKNRNSLLTFSIQSVATILINQHFHIESTFVGEKREGYKTKFGVGYDHVKINLETLLTDDQNSIYRQDYWPQNPLTSLESVEMAIKRVNSWRQLDAINPAYREFRNHKL